jgi:hypothetical protein
MADVRCPMCSNSNPEDADVCAFCSARLKPLVAGGDAGSAGESPRREEGDWLSRIRSDVRWDEAAEEGEETGEGAPDWLARLRGAEAEEEGPPEGEVPGWVAESAPAVEEPGPTPTPEPEPARESPGTDVPEWLARVRERRVADEPPPEEAPIEEAGDWLGRLREGEQALPDEHMAETPLQGERGFEESAEPAWPLAEQEAESEAGEPEPPLWAPPEPPEAEEELEPAALPPWLEPADRSTPQPPLEREAEPVPSWPPPPEAMADERLEAKRPDEGAGKALPHVPALVSDEPSPFPPGEGADFDLDAIELPDWLSDIKPVQAAPKPAEEPGASLAPATLPAWLEAMRPMETFRPIVEIESDEEHLVEASGPLAGLRGVLSAEPVVAMPRQLKVGSARLDISERQYAHAEFLQRLVQDEERELPPTAVVRKRLPVARWLVGLALVVAVALPTFAGFPAFAVPILGPPDLNAFISRVAGIPAERPALLVFDYEPGYTGELEAVAGPMLEHMMTRGLRLATVSTRPTGPPQAERLLQRTGQSHGYQNGRDYIHLGYLPGEPAAVQLFAQDPRQAVRRGFLPPADPETPGGWDSTLLSRVDALEDFGAVVLITAGAETARTWIEQATPRLGDVPLLMVLSAGVEPMVRPYYEALNPQVDAILAGLPAAAAYEYANGRPGASYALWGSFGSGVLVIELVLVLGGAYGLISWLAARRAA